MDDYQSMNFEFPDENIMLVTDYEGHGPDSVPRNISTNSLSDKGGWTLPAKSLHFLA